MEEEIYNCDDWFEATIIESSEHPTGFMEWTEGITQYKYNVKLPDNCIVNVRSYIDLNGTFDNGSYTNMLVNRYKDIYEL